MLFSFAIPRHARPAEDRIKYKLTYLPCFASVAMGIKSLRHRRAIGECEVAAVCRLSQFPRTEANHVP
jgi:hypothetical protein